MEPARFVARQSTKALVWIFIKEKKFRNILDNAA
jgi:hypothetical protein